MKALTASSRLYIQREVVNEEAVVVVFICLGPQCGAAERSTVLSQLGRGRSERAHGTLDPQVRRGMCADVTKSLF